MVEAELGDGDIGQITQAIQNALRPSVNSSPRVSNPGPQNRLASLDVPEVEIEQDYDQDVEEEASPPEPRPRVNRKPPPTPSILEIDLKSDVSLADYTQGKTPTSDRKKFLLIAAWFKNHRQLDVVTVDHIYTAYRWLKWSVGIADFGQPLRKLKHEQYMTSPEKGQFAINHLGLDLVDKLLAGED
jgi:hypothetical protein